jgi:hypothetical protein
MLSESEATSTFFENPKRKRKTFKNPKRERKFRFASRRFWLKAKIASEFTSSFSKYDESSKLKLDQIKQSLNVQRMHT